MKRTLKFLHEVSTVGIMGALAAHLILVGVIHSRHLNLVETAAIRQGILALTQWLLLPSLLGVLVSGLLSMAVHRPFHNAGWVWIKALLGVSVLEGTLGGVQGTARTLATLSTRAAQGLSEPGDAAALAATLRHERGGLWVILLLAVVNIALAVYRPRFQRRRPAPAPQPASPERNES